MTSNIIAYIVVATLVIGALWFMTMQKPAETYANYRTLSTQYDNPLFSPDMSKRCAGGPYMYTTDPYTKAMCQSMDQDSLACKQCTRAGFNGKPVHFEYTALSNGCWGNSRCNEKPTTSLCVL